MRTINNAKLVCNGVDRVGNKQGYTVENCVSACKLCNVMKSSRTKDHYIDHCRRVAAQHQEKN